MADAVRWTGLPASGSGWRHRWLCCRECASGLRSPISSWPNLRWRMPRSIAARLAERGVLVRHYPHPRLRACLRITSGRPAENDRMYAALAAVLATQPEETRS